MIFSPFRAKTISDKEKPISYSDSTPKYTLKKFFLQFSIRALTFSHSFKPFRITCLPIRSIMISIEIYYNLFVC